MSAYRFLPGLFIVQVAAAALVTAAASGVGLVSWALLAVASLLITLAVGLWFASIAEHARKDILAEAREKFALERERLAVAAEVEKRTIIEESHRKIVQETNRAHARANFKLGAAVAGMMAIAGVLLYVELFTLALVTLTTAGGALAGYVIRARQDALALKRQQSDQRILSATYTVDRNLHDEAAAAMRPAPTRERNRR